jgi:putative flippase GtrA
MKIVRYFFVGGVAAVADFLIYAVLLKTGICAWFSAAVVGFVVATWINYQLSIRHVFESCTRFCKQHEIFMVFAVSGIGLAVNQSCLYVLIERLGLDVLIAKICATGIVFLWNYYGRKNFIFLNIKPTDNAANTLRHH